MACPDLSEAGHSVFCIVASLFQIEIFNNSAAENDDAAGYHHFVNPP